MKKCKVIPHRIRERVGAINFGALAALSKPQVANLMAEPKPLHRFAQVMAGIFYEAVNGLEAALAVASPQRPLRGSSAGRGRVGLGRGRAGRAPADQNSGFADTSAGFARAATAGKVARW